VVVKTTDDYLLRIFCIAFTKRRPNQIRKTTYAASSQIRAIRKKMTDIMTKEASKCSLAQLTTKLIPEFIGREIEKSSQGIYPLQNVHIRKVKLLKAPKFDLGALLALHGESTTDESGQKVCISGRLPPCGTLVLTAHRLSGNSRSRSWRTFRRWRMASEGEDDDISCSLFLGISSVVSKIQNRLEKNSEFNSKSEQLLCAHNIGM
jgi:hypothetical protein